MKVCTNVLIHTFRTYIVHASPMYLENIFKHPIECVSGMDDLTIYHNPPISSCLAVGCWDVCLTQSVEAPCSTNIVQGTLRSGAQLSTAYVQHTRYNAYVFVQPKSVERKWLVHHVTSTHRG